MGQILMGVEQRDHEVQITLATVKNRNRSDTICRHISKNGFEDLF